MGDNSDARKVSSMARFIALCCLALLGAAALQAATLSGYLLPTGRFRDWNTVKVDCSDTALCQIWSQQLANLPKGMTGSLLVSYQATVVDTAEDARYEAKRLSLKDQFNAYVGKGYIVAVAPWPKFASNGVIFTIRGLAHTSDKARAQSAVIYNLAFAHDATIVWLQVRQAATADELDAIDRAMKKIPSAALAEELAGYVADRWQGHPAAASPDAVPPEPPADTAPPAAAPDPDTPAPTAPPPGETPITPVAPVPPAAEPAAPPVAETPAVTPPAAPATPPVPTATPAEPAAPEKPRWSYEGGLLSLAPPAGWKVSTKAPFTFTGLPGVTVRLYPWESCRDNAERDRALASFAAGQRDVALGNFTQAPFTPDGATGVMVRYTDVDRKTLYGYCFAKSHRLWQLLVSVTGENAALPDPVQELLASLNIL